ncbi:hypothetical protein [Methylocaldum szegediense]|jgi:hypothetical protein|uniref:hypothetical protein n=1 Tax=Methylocaldum szegediense TaxID=73780 RepID=UPI0003FE6C36|nr:hypothetical protein [Methylocaldum szegediense]
MEKKTVIANIRAEITLTPEMQNFLTQFSDQENAWFARDGGEVLLGEFGYEWNSNFVEVTQAVIDSYFRDQGLSENVLPKVDLTDWRRGSWIMEAVITMFGTVGTTYTILKGVAELPKLADGLEETKNRLQKELSARFKKKVPERIEPVLSNIGIPAQLPAPVRANPVAVACSIDARPLRGLTPDIAKSHSIHLAVAVSRSALSVENLGDTAIENLRIGLFKSLVQKHSWSFGEAFSKSVPRLSGKQSISLSISQFTSEVDGSVLDLTDASPLYVDCWLQDNAGIYLFNFLLE